MEPLTVTGTVTDNAAQPLAGSLPINLTITLHSVNDPDSDPVIRSVDTTVLMSNGSGTFEHTFEIDDDKVIALGNHVNYWVYINSYLPNASTRGYEFNLIKAVNQSVIETATFHSNNLIYPVNTREFYSYTLAVYLNNDSLTLDSFEGVDSMMCDLMWDYGVVHDFMTPPWRMPAVPLVSVPAFKQEIDLNLSEENSEKLWKYTAKIIVHPDDLVDKELSYQLRSEESDELRIRTQALPFTNTADLQANANILVTRIDEKVNAGSFNADFDEEITEGIVIIQDLAVEFFREELIENLNEEFEFIRATGRIGLGAWGFQLFSIARFEADIYPSFRYSGPAAFIESELNNLFVSDINRLEIDALPGTDLDDLPSWVYILLMPFAPTFSGAALVTKGLESALRPVLESEIQNTIKQEFDNQIEDSMEELIETQTNEFDLTPEELIALEDALWFQGEKLNITVNNVRALGWAGVSGKIIGDLIFKNFLSEFEDEDGNCPFSMAAGESEPAALPTMRQYETLLGVPDLSGWMEEYHQHSTELYQLVLDEPELTGQFIDLALDGSEMVEKGEEARLKASYVKRFKRWLRKAEGKTSPKLRKFLSEISEVLESGKGKKLAEIRALAAARKPAKKPAQPQGQLNWQRRLQLWQKE